jgi:hypothetical protein
MVNVTDGADVAVRLIPLELFLGHFSGVPSWMKMRVRGRKAAPAESGAAPRLLAQLRQVSP